MAESSYTPITILAHPNHVPLMGPQHKDIIDIARHKTSLCNRAWESLYLAKTKNAACVQVLIDTGAIIVGKTNSHALLLFYWPDI
ncbi:Amidase [Penicillium camemberti]|uniref:Amidase n=1 Tax=Penicillium camemberti (strain FM 013) TaxID=1429867 RepID=A0A0G4P6I1_PENC3|nr:Amidase [Penicillium camemberti]